MACITRLGYVVYNSPNNGIYLILRQRTKLMRNALITILGQKY